MPALLTTMSNGPSCAITACTAVASLTSSPATSAPVSRASSEAAATSRSAITTLAPAPAKLRTIAAPMPRAPPETKARRPSRRPNGKVATSAPREDRLAPLDHGGEPFAGIGHSRELGNRARLFRQALLDAGAGAGPNQPLGRRQRLRRAGRELACQRQRCVGKLGIGHDLG